MDSTPSPQNAAQPVERPSRRERARAATIDEIKETALTLMREQGSVDLRFSDIAREMGMTAPALYRYFADRDELLTALIVDAYDDLGASVAARRDAVPAGDLTGRFYAVAAAYREWAREEPQRFALIFGLPVPGYVAPEEGPTTEAAKRAMAQLKLLFADAAHRGLLGRPLIQEVSEPLCYYAVHEHPPMTPDDTTALPPETFQGMLSCWSLLHGFVSLETYGHYDFMPPDARDGLFSSVVRLAATASGFPWSTEKPAPDGGQAA